MLRGHAVVKVLKLFAHVGQQKKDAREDLPEGWEG